MKYKNMRLYLVETKEKKGEAFYNKEDQNFYFAPNEAVSLNDVIKAELIGGNCENQGCKKVLERIDPDGIYGNSSHIGMIQDPE